MTEKEMIRFLGKPVKVTCTSGRIFEGNCEVFESSLDNEPNPASISIENYGGLVEITAPEIKSIEIIED